MTTAASPFRKRSGPTWAEPGRLRARKGLLYLDVPALVFGHVGRAHGVGAREFLCFARLGHGRNDDGNLNVV